MRMPVTILAMAALVISYSASCGGAKGNFVVYDGPPRPASEVAIIKAASPGTMISGVDDTVKKRPFHFKQPLEVLPGRHVVHINYCWYGAMGERRTSAQTEALEFVAEAGHTYGVKTDGGPRRWRVWIIDQYDSTSVANEIESDLQ